MTDVDRFGEAYINVRNSNKTVYGLEQIGCYADGTFGHDHIRSKLSVLLKELTCTVTDSGDWRQYGAEDYLPILDAAKSLLADLDGDPSDDFSEEDDAIALLNEHATDDTVLFGMFEGDLMLASNCQWESEFDESIGVGTTSDNL